MSTFSVLGAYRRDAAIREDAARTRPTFEPVIPHPPVDIDALVERVLREGDDDHFYGAWTGGKKSEGGHPTGAKGSAGADAQTKAARDWEMTIAREELSNNPHPGYGKQFGNERGAVFDASGKVVWTGTGEVATLRHLDIKGLQPGAMMTHFHPDTTPGKASLSLGDVKTAMSTGATIRAFNADGSWEQFRPAKRYPGGIGLGNQDFLGYVMERYRKDGGNLSDVQRTMLEELTAGKGTWSRGGTVKGMEFTRPNGEVLTEASSDDHFYGAWTGGKASAGGHPMTDAERLASRAAKRLPSAYAADDRIARGGEYAMRKTPWDPTHGEFHMAAAHILDTHPELPRFDGPQWKGPPNTLLQRKTDSYETWTEFAYTDDKGRVAGVMSLNVGIFRAIGGVTVRPDLRGKGIASKMYDAVQDTTSINLYQLLGNSGAFTPAGKAFATSWLERRIALEEKRAGLREAKGRERTPLEWARWALKRVTAAKESPDGVGSP